MDVRQTANQQKYDFTASVYDIIAFLMSLGQIKKIYHEVAQALDHASKTIVELGCGPASVTPYLLETVGTSSQIIGIDFSEKMIQIANQKKVCNGWENVVFECMDIYDFPGNKKADIVIFCLALTAIPNATRALEKAISILKPGGQLIIADSFPLHSRWWHPFTNLYISVKSLVVGAKPTKDVLDFIEKNMADIQIKEMVGGVYTMITARSLW